MLNTMSPRFSLKRRGGDKKIHLIKYNHLECLNILRKTIEGYVDSVPSLTFKTIKTKLIMYAFHSSRYLNECLI